MTDKPSSASADAGNIAIAAVAASALTHGLIGHPLVK
jgi:hypothetical protein